VKVKYPRTYHSPWSLGVTNDDKVIKDTSSFIGNEVVLLEKMDGENTTLSRDYIHARSLDSVDHPSRHWVKGIWGQIRHNIPEGYRICGENLFAKHSIEYNDLPNYFMVFNIWDENNICLSFDETLEWCNLLEIQHVPVLWRGIYDENFIKNFELDFSKQEGYVVRLTKSFHYDDFEKSVMKMVKKGHVQTDSHWMFQKVVPNKLKNI
jgi:hypothetical protein